MKSLKSDKEVIGLIWISDDIKQLLIQLLYYARTYSRTFQENV